MKSQPHFGKWVRDERVKRSLTLSQLGDLIGVGERRMWGIERAPEPRIRPGARVGLAKAFDIPIEKFNEMWPAAAPGAAPKVAITRTAKLAAIRRMVEASGLSVAEVVEDLKMRRVGSTGRPASRKAAPETPTQGSRR